MRSVERAPFPPPAAKASRGEGRRSDVHGGVFVQRWPAATDPCDCARTSQTPAGCPMATDASAYRYISGRGAFAHGMFQGCVTIYRHFLVCLLLTKKGGSLRKMTGGLDAPTSEYRSKAAYTLLLIKRFPIHHRGNVLVCGYVTLRNASEYGRPSYAPALSN